MRGGGLGLPDRVQNRDFGAVAAAWGVLEDLGVIIAAMHTGHSPTALARRIHDVSGIDADGT